MSARKQTILWTATAALFGGLTSSTIHAQQRGDDIANNAAADNPEQRTERMVQPGTDRPAMPGKGVQNTYTGEDKTRTADNMQRDSALAGDISRELQKIAQDRSGKAGDKLFVLMTACENQSEIELARRAKEKTNNQEIKQLSDQLIRDHEQLAQKLQPIAQELNVQPPQTINRDKQLMHEILLSLPEEDFNKAYLSHLKACHAHDISKFQDKAQLAKTESVKNFARESVTSLRQHAQHVSRAGQSVGLAATDYGNPD